MKIVDLYGMSEEERKKALQEQQSMYNERMQQSDEIRKQANQQFNDLISKNGQYNTEKHTTTVGALEKAYKDSSAYNKVHNSLRRMDLSREDSIWNRIKNIASSNANNYNNQNSYISRNDNGMVNRTATAINMANQNNRNANMILKTQLYNNAYKEALNAYKEALKDRTKNSIEYRNAKAMNPNASEEELYNIAENQTKNKEKQFDESFRNMSEEDRKKEIYKIQKILNNNDGLFETEEKKNENKRIINNLFQKSEAIEAEKKAEKVNKTLNEGNFIQRATTATGELASSMTKSAIDSTISPILSVGSLAEGILPTKDYKGPKFDDVIDYKKIKDYGEAVKNQNIENDVLKTGKGVSTTIGGMIPSIVANILAPGSGMLGSNIGATIQALGVAGQDYIENLNEDKTNKVQSAISGTLKGLGSYATERITGGNILGKGSLDDWATRTIANKTSSKVAQKIASKIYEVGGENFEELLENQIDHLVDATVNNKGITFEEWLNEQSETVKQTTLTQLFLNLMGIGGNTYNEVQDYKQNAEMKQWINEAQKIIDKENLSIDNMEINENNINEVRKTINQLPKENENSNLQQQSTQNEQNIPTQQITQEQNKVTQNGNMEQMTNQQKIDEIAKNKPSFSKQIDQYVAKKYPSGDFLFLGKTPDVLTKLGAPDNQIILKQNKLKSLIEQSNDDTSKLHGVPIETIKRLPEAIANPLNILKSSTDENSIVIITDLADTKERPIIASIELNYDGQIGNIDFLSNRLTSAYGKNNYDRFMQTEIAKGNLLYDIDEGIIKELPTTRLQSSKGISSFDETSSFINNSISQIDTKVNENTITNNYAQSNENNTQNEQYQATKGETIDWGEMERPEGKIRKHYRSIIESSNTTAEAKAIAKEMMGLDTYIPQSNKTLLKRADLRISESNPETELSSLLSRVMNNEKVNDLDIAVGERLIEYYSKIGDSEHLLDAIHAQAMAGTQAGRTTQALALLNHMTPQGQVVWLERSVNKANKELEQKFKNKKNIPQFELTSDMTEKILNTKSKEEMYKVLDDVYEELGQQVPKTTLEKIDEWRYFSMLANIKTHGRNMIGNLAMNLTQRAKNKVAGAIEGTVAKFNSEMERTHTIVPTSKRVKDFAKNDVKNMDVQTELGMNENKYNPQSRLQSARRTFKSDVLENTLGKMFDLNSKLLEVEDNIGLKSMYVKSLGEYITANKIDIDNMTDAQLSKARQHAIKEAQEATFHQASALATALNQMGRKNNITKFALDAVVPFKKTPINVAKTGIQYSPVGLIKSAVYDVGKLRKGDITVNQYIDNISKGLTGTGIAYLGYALAQAGILKASGSDDDKKEKYEEEQGKQSYSIEIGGKTYSLDWLSPVGIPLFIGAEINQQFNTSKKEKNSKSNDDNEALNQIVQSVANIANASANAMNPMSEMSMISGLTSALSSYNKENAVGDMIVNTGKSYINQFVPTALGQLARTTDDYERTTKSTKTGTLEKAVDSTINQIKSKIPGLRQTLPTKTDIWGKDIKQSKNLPFRAFNNFINPSKVQNVSTDKVDKELNSLYAKTGESSIIPKAIDKKYTIDGIDYRMTDKEYAKYYQKYGETSYELINGLINSKDYKDLTNEQKQKAIENVYSYAKESNKLDYANNNNLEVDKSTLYKTMESLKNNGGNCSNYLVYIGKTQGITGKGASKKKIGILADSDYSDITKKLIYENTEGNEDKKLKLVEKLKLPITEYLRYKSNKFENDKDEDNETISGTKKQKVVSYLQSVSDRKLPIEYKKIIAKIEGINDFNSDIVNYINNKNNLTQSDKKELLEIIGFKVTKEGNVQNTTILPITKNVK